jgi:hypothetical protein
VSGPRPGHAGTGREDGEADEARGDAADDALDETDVDPTGNVLHNEPDQAIEGAAGRGAPPSE